MSEEQRIVLRMLEEGKITAQEAEGLLKALSEGAKHAEREPKAQTDPWVRVEKMGEDFASKVELAAERFSRSIEHNLGDKLSRLPKVLARIPFLGQGESQEFTSIVRGTVGAGEVIPIQIINASGSVHVQGWDEEEYQLTVVQRLRGGDQELPAAVFALDWEDGVEGQTCGSACRHWATLACRFTDGAGAQVRYKLESQNRSLRLEN